MGDGVIFGGLLAVGVAAFLVWVLFRRRRLSPAEHGHTPLLAVSCSARPGNLGALAHANFPGVRLAVYPDFLVLGFLSPVAIRFVDLTSVEIRDRALSGRCVSIVTTNGIAYELSVKDPETVANLLRKNVKRPNSNDTWLCSKCREENPADFEVCWKCQAAPTRESP